MARPDCAPTVSRCIKTTQILAVVSWFLFVSLSNPVGEKKKKNLTPLSLSFLPPAVIAEYLQETSVQQISNPELIIRQHLRECYGEVSETLLSITIFTSSCIIAPLVCFIPLNVSSTLNDGHLLKAQMQILLSRGR